MKYDCIDSFSGAGGLSIGLNKSGISTILTFDNDQFSIETQKLNPKYFKHSAIKEDINNLLDGKILSDLKIKKGELFLFAGGPPCQGFSIQRVGSDTDQRNELVSKYLDMVEELNPKFFLMENVPGILGKRGKTVLVEYFKRVESIGYKIAMKILNAQDFGVPQRRRRVFVIGIRDDVYYKPFEFPEPITPEGKRITVRDTIGFLPEPPATGDYPGIIHHRRDKLSSKNLMRIRALSPGQGRDYLPKELLADCHKADSSMIGHRNVYGRMPWDDVSPTITARFDSFTRGMFGHPSQDRTITLREGALLQTFPKDFIFSGNKVEIARQIGNAVPCKLAEVVGKQIIKYYEDGKKESKK